jgi:hypothetical protein
MLRCACLTYLSDVRGRPEAEARLRREAAASREAHRPEAVL